MNGKSPNTQKLESLRSNRSFWEHQTGAGKMWFLSFYGSFDIKSPLPGFIMYFTASLVQKLEAAPFVLVGPTSPVAAVAGQGVMLPCSLHPRRNAANMTVRWTRVADVVHHYSSGQDQYEEQGLSYHGRTGLSKEGLVSGSMALHIVAVRPADEGQYVCFVQDGSDYERATLTLEVAAPFYLGVFPWMVALIVTLVAWTGSLVLIAYLLKTKARQSAEWGKEAAELAHVTWDPDTAHPLLCLSADRRRVERREAPQLLPQCPGRFNTERCVLGSEGFTGGRHAWVVEVAEGGHWWAVGVAARSVRRTGSFSFSPEGKIWAVGKLMGRQRVFTAPHPTPLPLDRVPQRIQVLLDYTTGQVVFSDADSWAMIFIFPLFLPARERLYPWLWLGEAGTHLGVCT
ncbi:butyrophilin subfamily 3 member A1-like isoform X2 [Rhea pennata]|uniref:butyrophilin subfamily 3 member A1-like isoform X2 n=1 Tax=Rhea pennata TaxID=8795 RepID=UPI002E2545B8